MGFHATGIAKLVSCLPHRRVDYFGIRGVEFGAKMADKTSNKLTARAVRDLLRTRDASFRTLTARQKLKIVVALAKRG